MISLPHALVLAAVLFLLATCEKSARRDRTDLPPGFIAISVPDSGSATESCARYSAIAWAPSLGPDSTELRIGPAMFDSDDMRLSREVHFTDGRLIARDRGEFGGGVSWFPTGSRDSVVVWSVNVMRLLQRGDTVFGVGGLSHLDSDYGTVLRITRGSRGWNADTVVDLGSAPVAVQELGKDSLLVVTTSNLQLVDLRQGTRRVAYSQRHWPFAYPSAVVFRDRAGRIYVGLSYAVARVDLHDRSVHEEWLVPASCPGFRMTDSTRDESAHCQCLSPAK